MTQKKLQPLKYIVPIIALAIVCLQWVLVNTHDLSRWKGGGFGMYSEVHYYFDEVYIDHLETSLDSMVLKDRTIGNMLMDVKRMPTTNNLDRMAKLIAKHVLNDTVTVQVWKPLIDAKTSSVTRRLVAEYHYIKP